MFIQYLTGDILEGSSSAALQLFGNQFDSHQEYSRRSPDERYRSGEFSLVASAVASSLPLSVLGQSQLLHPPLSHLRDSR